MRDAAPPEPLAPAPTTGGEPVVVDARGVSVRLGDSLIVHDVDLAVRRGEVVAVMGANGSGKSTLVRALVGVLPLAGGSVALFGTDLAGRRRDVPWRRLGYVPQRVSAATGVPATALEVVVSGLLDAHRLRPPRHAHARALAALAEVELAGRAHDDVRTLSGGQQQRVLIARALVRDPDLLVLDEPVAGVDRPSQDTFAATLTHLAGERLTVVVVLHELGSLAPLVRRCVVLRHGGIAYDGAPRPAAPEHAAPDHVHLHPHAGQAAPTSGSPVLEGFA